MNLYDFKGMFKYKLIMPTLFVISWVFMLMGQTRVFQDQYQYICLFIVFKEGIKLTLLAIYAGISWVQSWSILTRAEQINKRLPSVENELATQLIHVFVLPNCKEPRDLLIDTISQIARHAQASKRYALMLAMEGHQPGAVEKAQDLINHFRGQFRYMGYTVHELRPHQQKWKASNATWCVQHLPSALFEPYGINPDNVIVTVPDADSWVPEIYIHQVEKHYLANYDHRYEYIYCPNQMFMINNLDVPILNRTLDDLHASLHNANMISCFGLAFPLSNYSFSYKLIKEIDYWDTTTDNIADDYHIVMKAVWKTEGRAKAIPIWTPFNQTNLSTGKGYCSDMKAKFWQVERHGTGVLEVAYGFNMLERYGWNFKGFMAALITFDTFLPAVTLPWAMISLAFEGVILVRYEKVSPEVIPFSTVLIFINYVTAATFFIYLFYFLIKRRASRVLYNRSESWWRIIEVMIFLGINTFFVNIPCLVIATFSVLFSNKQFERSDKNLERKKEIAAQKK